MNSIDFLTIDIFKSMKQHKANDGEEGWIWISDKNIKQIEKKLSNGVV